MSILSRTTLVGIVALALLGCSREERLEGTRVDLRAPWGGGAVTENRSAPVALGAQAVNSAWTQRQGTSGARPQHPALSDTPQLVWSTPIGAGDSRRARLTTDPVAADGRIFTLDAAARVQATSTDGAVLWSADITPARGQRASASGGALAVGGGRVFVASAFAVLVALDASTGREIWRADFTSPLTGSPAVQGDAVYVSEIDNTMWSLDAATGRIQWSLPGTATLSTVARGSAPAIAGDLVVFPSQAGELVAVRRSNGGQIWNSAASGRRTGAALSSISALTGDPVISGNRLYAANQSGRIVALNTATGEAIWSAQEAAYGPVWPVGDAVFLVSDENRLLRLNAADGALVWAQELPLYTTERVRRRLAVYPQHGPILAGGRLWVASGDGVLRGFDPASGARTTEIAIPGGAASGPIVVGRTLYILGREGVLHAYR